MARRGKKHGKGSIDTTMSMGMARKGKRGKRRGGKKRR
jgi:hypothetical protein